VRSASSRASTAKSFTTSRSRSESGLASPQPQRLHEERHCLTHYATPHALRNKASILELSSASRLFASLSRNEGDEDIRGEQGDQTDGNRRWLALLQRLQGRLKVCPGSSWRCCQHSVRSAGLSAPNARHPFFCS
jgi:hypothetical protein